MGGGRRSPCRRRPSPWRRAGDAAVRGGLGRGGGREGGEGSRAPSTGGGRPTLTCGAVRGAVRSCCLCVAAACGAPAQRTAAPDVGLGWQQKGGFFSPKLFVGSSSVVVPPAPARHKGRQAGGGAAPGEQAAPHPPRPGRRGGGSTGVPAQAVDALGSPARGSGD